MLFLVAAIFSLLLSFHSDFAKAVVVSGTNAIPNPLVGGYSWTYGGSYGPPGANLQSVFAGIDTVQGMITSFQEGTSTGFVTPGAAQYLTIGGGGSVWTVAMAADLASSASVDLLINSGYTGIIFDIEGTSGAYTDLVPAFHSMFKAYQAANVRVILTTSHAAPFTSTTPQDSVELIKAWVNDTAIDILSPQLYSGYADPILLIDSSICVDNGFSCWSFYTYGTVPIAPSLTNHSQYDDAKTFFGSLGRTTVGYMTWQQYTTLVTATPSTATPTTAAPTTNTPSTASPSTAAPTTATPTTATPSTASPSTAAPTTATPSTATPTTATPTTSTPTTSVPTTLSPTTPTTPTVPSTVGCNTPLTLSVNTAGSTGYTFSSYSGVNPSLQLVAGNTYTFQVNTGAGPFYINAVQGTGSDKQYTTLVSNNGAADGASVQFTPLSSLIGVTLYYNNGNNAALTGTITFISPLSCPSPAPTTAATTTNVATTATAAPTTVTAAPTTATPTTAATSTPSPSTATPSTDTPTTVQATTVTPSTASPSTETPTTQVATTVLPTTSSPSTSAPTTTSVPSTAAPTTTPMPTTVAPTTAPTTPVPCPPQFPYLSSAFSGSVCFNTASAASAGSGSVGSWCALTAVDPTILGFIEQGFGAFCSTAYGNPCPSSFPFLCLNQWGASVCFNTPDAATACNGPVNSWCARPNAPSSIQTFVQQGLGISCSSPNANACPSAYPFLCTGNFGSSVCFNSASYATNCNGPYNSWCALPGTTSQIQGFVSSGFGSNC